jgi:hypothetical protein
MNILEKANENIYGERAKAYGPVSENFHRIAVGWGQIIGTPISERQVGLMMAWLKIARDVNRPMEDNLVDGAGYFGCIGKLEEEIKSERLVAQEAKEMAYPQAPLPEDNENLLMLKAMQEQHA